MHKLESAGVAKPGQRRRSLLTQGAKLRMSQGIKRFLKPCSLGIRGFKSHPPHLHHKIAHIIRSTILELHWL